MVVGLIGATTHFPDQAREIMARVGEGNVPARTLIVHGDRDDFFPVEIPVALYRGIRGSALWIVPGGDHVPIYGLRTGPFLDESLRFLKE